jgi:4-amino-4-deoxy-L-arabinose transferase-like glycosyltransferase
MESTLILPTAARTWTWRMSLVLGLAAVLFLARLGQRALWSEELRWVEIPREMQLHSNYFWPTINGHTYYDKPLGSYWLVLLASWGNNSVDEWAARLPSALCGILGVLLLMVLSRRLYDEPTAVLAGLVLATSFSYVFFSRLASTDVETVAGVLACLWLFHRNQQRRDGWWVLLFWLFMALTSLTKGLLGFVLPILMIGVYSSLTPAPEEASSPGSRRSLWSWRAILMKRNRWFFNSKSLLAIPLGLVVYLSPFLLSVIVTGSAEGLHMVYRENIRRFFDPVNHRGPIYLYLYVIFILLAPWSLLLPAALVQAHQSARTEVGRGDSNRFVLVCFWATFLFFTFSSSRRSYYLLPVLPAASMLIARLLTRDRGSLRLSASLLLRGGYGLLALVAAASLVLLLPPSWVFPNPWNQIPALPFAWVFAALWLTWMVTIGMAIYRRQSRWRVRSFAWISVCLMAYLFLMALPEMEAFRTQKSFAGAVKETLGSDTQAVALFRHRDLVYYLDQPSPLAEYGTKEALTEAIQEERVRWVILRRCDVAAVPVASKTLASERVYPWEPAADAAKKLVLLELCR